MTMLKGHSHWPGAGFGATEALSGIPRGRCARQIGATQCPPAPPAPVVVAPYFVSYPNVLSEWTGFQNRELFTHYEIQTVRERTVEDSTFHTTVTMADCEAEADNLGPVLYGVYGRNQDGTAEHLFDRVTKEAAEDTLCKMGVSL